MTDTPQLCHEQAAEIAQEHEDFLTQLESLAIGAIASGNWWPVYDLISEVETWQGEQALLQEKNQTEDPMKELWALAFPKETHHD
jgi:hypothetical protein